MLQSELIVPLLPTAGVGGGGVLVRGCWLVGWVIFYPSTPPQGGGIEGVLKSKLMVPLLLREGGGKGGCWWAD